MMKNRITILMVGILMISCVLLEEKLGGEDPELVFYIVPELEVNIGGYYLLPLNEKHLLLHWYKLWENLFAHHLHQDL